MNQAIAIPVLTTIRIYLSRPVIPVTLAILVPIAPTVQIYQSWAAIPVKFSIIICNNVPSVLKGTTGFEDGEYGFPGF